MNETRVAQDALAAKNTRTGLGLSEVATEEEVRVAQDALAAKNSQK